MKLTAAILFEYAALAPIKSGKGAPSGWVSIRRPKKISWRYRHGVAQYTKPLDPRQIMKYNLLPVSPTDPWVSSEAREALGDLLRFEVMQSGSADLDTKNGHHFVVEHLGGSNWATYLENNQGVRKFSKPFKSIEEAAEYLWNYIDNKLKDKLLREVTPKF